MPVRQNPSLNRHLANSPGIVGPDFCQQCSLLRSFTAFSPDHTAADFRIKSIHHPGSDILRARLT